MTPATDAFTFGGSPTASGFYPWAAISRVVAAQVLVSWVPLLLITFVASGGSAPPFLFDQAVAVRFLVAAPILICSGPFTRMRTLQVYDHLASTGIVSAANLPAFKRLAEQLAHLRDSDRARAAIALAVIFGAALLRLDFVGESSSWQFASGPAGVTRTAAGWWYIVVSVPLFQFLLAWSAWRYLLWCFFLLQVARLGLVLVPTHPDRAAGLTVIAKAHENFATVAFALSSILSVYIGSQILEGGRVLSDYRLHLATFVLTILAFMLGPLLVFTPGLARARRLGLLAYGSLASTYTQAFHRKWISQEAAENEPLLGSADVQSLADLGNSYQIVQDMRLVPFGVRTILAICLWSVAPLSPLVFLAFSPLEVLKGLAGILL